jgi:hypothetical protein
MKSEHSGILDASLQPAYVFRSGLISISLSADAVIWPYTEGVVLVFGETFASTLRPLDGRLRTAPRSHGHPAPLLEQRDGIIQLSYIRRSRKSTRAVR